MENRVSVLVPMELYETLLKSKKELEVYKRAYSLACAVNAELYLHRAHESGGCYSKEHLENSYLNSAKEDMKHPKRFITD